MIQLTEAERLRADELGLTASEFRIAKSTRIDPITYARRKLEIAAERSAESAMLDQFGAALTDHLQFAVRGRGEPLPPVEDTDQT